MKDVIVGGAVIFHFHTFLLFGNDDIECIKASVDDMAEVVHGEVVEIAGLMPLLIYHVLPALSEFGLPKPAAFPLNGVFIFG